MGRRPPRASPWWFILAGASACVPFQPAIAPQPSMQPVETQSLVLGSPSPGPDSNLSSEDQSAIDSLLVSNEFLSYLPANLIHDGGVILFRTLLDVSDAEPDAWSRENVTTGIRRDVFRKVATGDPSARAASVDIQIPMSGSLVYQDPQSGQIDNKSFNEVFDRKFLFRLNGNQWGLDALTPVKLAPTSDVNGFRIDRLALFHLDSPVPIELGTDFGELTPLASVPNFSPGETLRVEADVSRQTPGGIFAYVHVVGQDDRLRVPMSLDGPSPDHTSQVFTGLVTVPSTPGVEHLAIDVLGSGTFSPGGLYSGLALGRTFNVTP